MTDFTEKEAKEQQGKHVRVLDDSFEGVQKGTHGHVVAAILPIATEVAVDKECWAFNIRFYPKNIHPASILVEYIGKDQYVESLQEAYFKYGV